MKPRAKPLSMTRDVKSGMTVFRTVSLRGICCSRTPKWTKTDFGGPYRERQSKTVKTCEAIGMSYEVSDKGFDSRVGVVVPESATDFTDDGFKVVFYRRFKGLGMNLLEWFDGKDWQVAGTLPWAKLIPVSEF